MSTFCEYGIVLWLLSVMLWVIIWQLLYNRSHGFNS